MIDLFCVELGCDHMLIDTFDVLTEGDVGHLYSDCGSVYALHVLFKSSYSLDVCSVFVIVKCSLLLLSGWFDLVQA